MKPDEIKEWFARVLAAPDDQAGDIVQEASPRDMARHTRTIQEALEADCQ